jgi:hypothetical protein
MGREVPDGQEPSLPPAVGTVAAKEYGTMRRCIGRSRRSDADAPRVSKRASRGGATPVAGLRFRSRAALLVVRADHRPLSRGFAREQGRESGVVRRSRVAANNLDGDRRAHRRARRCAHRGDASAATLECFRYSSLASALVST